jgi:hypothetical protein
MPRRGLAFALLALTAIGIWAQDASFSNRQYHPAPDQDGVYYVGPEITAPARVRTVTVPYPAAVSDKRVFRE